MTITTIGYGDKFPVTGAGKGIAVVLMLAGIGLIGVLTATIASYLAASQLIADLSIGSISSM